MSIRIALSCAAASRKVISASRTKTPLIRAAARIDSLRLPPASGVGCWEAYRRRDGERRWMTSKPNYEESEVLYEGPMGPLITSLKTFSLTSSFLSSVGLPALLLYQGLDKFESVHLMMVMTTTAGSFASTLGLQWIFAPYVYRLERIPIRQCSYVKESEQEGATTANVEESSAERPTDQDATEPAQSTTPPQLAAPTGSFLLKATTRSLFLFQVEHIFDPEVDVHGVPGGTMRPFCSFMVKDKPIYIHEQMISDPELIQNLFVNHGTVIAKPNNPDPDAKRRGDPDDEFL